jgi:hypothetical protein
MVKGRALLVCAGIAVAVLANGAQADTLTYTGSVPLTITDWTSSVSVPQFNPSLGTLNSIEVTLNGHVEGSAAFESDDASPATVHMKLQALETFYRPDLSTMVTAFPVASTTDTVTAWDGVDDYAGTSGKTYGDLSSNASNSFTTSSSSDKALFTGVGNIVLPVDSAGAFTGSGAGNLLLDFATSASAGVTVTYNYTAPEPATMAILALGAIGLIRRGRRHAYGR